MSPLARSRSGDLIAAQGVGITGRMAILIFRYLDPSFLRMRRSSMKLSAVIAHSTDPNEIITIVSIGRGLLPRLPLQVHRCTKSHANFDGLLGIAHTQKSFVPSHARFRGLL